MYYLDNEHINRMNNLRGVIKYHYPWFDDFIAEQQTVVEFEIQKYWASKVDLIDKHVIILNSGIGYYSVPLAFQRGAKTVHTYDMDPTTAEICWSVNGQWQDKGYSHHHRNITFDYKHVNHNSDVYINTSCEHSYPMRRLLDERAKGKMCVMSGNNLTKRGHINLINSIDQLKEQCDLSEILNEDVMQFEYEDDLGRRNYQQFFLIGIK